MRRWARELLATDIIRPSHMLAYKLRLAIHRADDTISRPNFFGRRLITATDLHHFLRGGGHFRLRPHVGRHGFASPHHARF